MNRFDKQSLVQRLKELSFPEKEYWVVAGGAMVLHGFRPQTHDIDLGCSTLLADKLEQQGYFVSRCDDGTRKIIYSEDIEIFENWLEGTVEIISGVPVVCVGGLIQMKKKLGREKDWADIAFMKRSIMDNWFTIDKIDGNSYIISEYRHWEETHCYLLNGNNRSLLIDTGLGICNIAEEVRKLTGLPVTAAATHIHWDHIGGHFEFPDFYAHEAELDWLDGGFPLNMETIREMVLDRCDPPEDFRIEDYTLFQGRPTRVLQDGDIIDLGGRVVEVLHTPGHSPGHMCFFEQETGYLFTGDLIYKDVLFAYYPSTDPAAYLDSVERVAELPVQRVFPAHHDLNIQPEMLNRVRNAFRELKAAGNLHHGGGQFDYGDFGIWV